MKIRHDGTYSDKITPHIVVNTSHIKIVVVSTIGGEGSEIIQPENTITAKITLGHFAEVQGFQQVILNSRKGKQSVEKENNQENDEAPTGSNNYPPSAESENNQENDEAPTNSNDYPSSAEN